MRASPTHALQGFSTDAAPRGPIALLAEAIADIRSRRPLIRYLVEADMKKRGSDTLLGNFWWIMDPLLQMAVYVVLVTIIARGDTIPDYPLFIFAAILPWKWFNAAVIDATNSLVDQDRLIKRIQFPKIVLPIASTTAGVVVRSSSHDAASAATRSARPATAAPTAAAPAALTERRSRSPPRTDMAQS